MAQELAALHAALGMAVQPNLADHARKAAFPAGIALLLEIAAGDRDAIARCAAITDVSEDKIRTASEFYIEQVLLNAQCDNYRALGADQSASSTTLRRNMALLMRWLHPDAFAHSSSGASLDRTVFAERVAAAWENLKSNDRRSAYDAQIARIAKSGSKLEKVEHATHASPKRRTLAAKKRTQTKPGRRTSSSSFRKSRKARRRLRIVPELQDSWILRVLNLFRTKQ